MKRVHKIIETEPKMDDLVQHIGNLTKDIQRLAKKAVKDYTADVEAILKERSCDSKRIESCLDGILEFCFDDEMLGLYKKLCRYYYNIDAETTVSYINLCREMWDEN